MVHVSMLLRRSAALSAPLVLAIATAAAAQSGLQITPDGKRSLVDKTVGGERWAIVRSPDGVVTGNVYFPDGSDPEFVSCVGTATPDVKVYQCSGADRCERPPCRETAWTAIGEVVLPDSFFLPESGATASAAGADLGAGGAFGDPGSGMQIAPDRNVTLVNKDLEGERWSIARFADDSTVAGIVRLDDGSSRFVWCEQLGVSGGDIRLACSGADSCRQGPCTTEQWTSLGEVSVPEAFFAPPAVEELSPSNAASLELLWDFPIPAGVTAFPVVTDEFVYVGGWNGVLYALDPDTGAVRWSFDTGTGGTGIQASVTLLDGGDLLLADWITNVYRLDARTGALRWKRLVGDPAVDHVWSAVTVGGGRIFVGIASHSDNPCTNGRTVALDLDTGDPLWTRQNVPDRVCTTDTATACDEASDCPAGGDCVQGRGAGVTASPALSADAEFVYVNTVGCYTFPSIGDSDAMMKLDAATGETIWLNRVQPPEQFGSCSGDRSIDCGTDAACAGKGTCQTKGVYHDFGFLNGPLLLDVRSGGETSKLLVSGSKDGTLYALRESDGEIAWKTVVLPTPVSPAFAGFGLFNGAVAYEDGRLFAALNEHIPATVPAPPHLMAFDVRDGDPVWTSDIGPAWASVGVRNRVLLTGANEASELYVYDANDGTRLKTLPLPATTASRPALVRDRAYVAYGIISAVGGIRAYGLP